MVSPDKIHPDCRAARPTHVVTNMFAICQTALPTCPHRVAMEAHVLCFHPLRHKIIAQTDRLSDQSPTPPPPVPPAD